MAGVVLYVLHCDNEPSAEIYSVAGDVGQANIVFNTAQEMTRNSPKLRHRTDSFARSMFIPKTGAVYKLFSSDAATKHGFNPHLVAFDEFHAQPNDKLYNIFRTSGAARRQPLLMIVTTAGFDRNSVCYQVHEHALKVRDGIIPDDAFLAIIFASDPEDDWTDKKTWKKANPNLGVTIKWEYMRQECQRARTSPAIENTFKNWHLNIWTEQAVRYIPMHEWDKCNQPVPIEELKGEPCFAGLDLSSTTDISAWLMLFPPTEKRPRYDILCRFWVPEENMALRAQRDRVPYPIWAKQGLIEATEGNVIDQDWIRRRINGDAELYHIVELAVDRWQAAQLMTQLTGDGFLVVPFGQGMRSMSAPTKGLLPLVLKHQLRHGGHPVLRWMASNLAVKRDAAENLKPDKEHSQDRIDGMVSLVMAYGRCMLQAEPAEPEVILL